SQKAKITFKALIKDITNKAYSSSNSKINSLALYRNNNPPKKSTAKKRAKSSNRLCLYYKQLKLFYKANNYFAINKKKRKA
ncbi:hypothetical protein BUE80_DR011894, partial [Diplocarpon rosae]